MLGPHESFGHLMAHEGAQAVIETVDVQQANRLGVDAQLGPGHHLEQLFQRAHPARHGDEAFGQVGHHRFALVHVLDDEQAREARVADFALDEGARDDAGGFAAQTQHFIGDHAHQADLAAAVDEADIVVDHGARQQARSIGVDRVDALRGAAVDSKGFHRVHFQRKSAPGLASADSFLR